MNNRGGRKTHRKFSVKQRKNYGQFFLLFLLACLSTYSMVYTWSCHLDGQLSFSLCINKVRLVCFVYGSLDISRIMTANKMPRQPNDSPKQQPLQQQLRQQKKRKRKPICTIQSHTEFGTIVAKC